MTSSLLKTEAQSAQQQAELAKKTDQPLPEGWRKVASNSRPGEFVYENIYTEERQAWFPTEPAVKSSEVDLKKVVTYRCVVMSCITH